MSDPTKCVVFFSGGVMSWAAGKRAVERFGPANTILLFTDTLIEDADLYRFLDDAAANIGAPSSAYRKDVRSGRSSPTRSGSATSAQHPALRC